MTTSATTSAATEPPPAGAPAAGRGALLRVEVHRMAARRFVQVLVLVGTLGLVAGVVIASTQYAEPSAQDLANARALMTEEMQRIDEFRQQCLDAPPPADVPEGVTPEEFCGPPANEQGLDPAWFLDKPPFVLADALPNGATGVGVATSAVLFLIGASYIGAEWSSRTIVALLSWEPRRLTVLAVKVVVTALTAAVLGAVAQAMWVLAAVVLSRTRGTTGDLPTGFWGDVLAQQGRLVALAVLAALLGFGLANLLRNTGAALGVAFIWFSVVESAVGIFRPVWSQYLISQNAIALVAPGGYRIYVPGDVAEEAEMFDDAGRELLLTNVRGGLTLLLYCAVILIAGAWLFRRRDLH